MPAQESSSLTVRCTTSFLILFFVIFCCTNAAPVDLSSAERDTLDAVQKLMESAQKRSVDDLGSIYSLIPVSDSSDEVVGFNRYRGLRGKRSGAESGEREVLTKRNSAEMVHGLLQMKDLERLDKAGR